MYYLHKYPVKLSDSFGTASRHQVLIYRGPLAMLEKKLIIEMQIFKWAEEANGWYPDTETWKNVHLSAAAGLQFLAHQHI